MSNKNYIRVLVDDYCVLDTETTGFSCYYDEIIEIGILKVRNNKIVDKYNQLIKPNFELNFITTELTGITNEMLEDKPTIDEVKNEVMSFLGEDILLGHYTSFDLRFLNHGFNTVLENKYIDTLQFSRKIFPELKHHRLSDLTEYLNISKNEHRSITDCIATKELYDCIKNIMNEKGLEINDLWRRTSSGKSIDIKSIKPSEVEIDEDNFFYNRHVVFTGKLEKMIREDAMQIIVNLGGVLDRSVTKSTNYLILGNNDYNAILKGEKSSKHKKAEELKLKGQDIEIIDEFTFYDIIES